MVAFANKQDVGIDDRTSSLSLWEQTKVTLRLVITYFNWIWVRSRLGTTAAQRADLTAEPWAWLDIAVYSTLC